MPRRPLPLPGIIASFALLLFQGAVHAGPPFATDDPEPVGLGRWEIYVAASAVRESGGREVEGLGPLLELNYGISEDAYLHIVAPFAFEHVRGGGHFFGYGETEAGAKYRFLEESDGLPEMAIYPSVELPTGHDEDTPSTGRVQVYLPLWLQKTWGPWTTYGGGGYWFNPGPLNRNWWFVGWEVQRKLSEAFTLGAEIYHTTADAVDTHAQTSLVLGCIYDLSDTYHLLVSVGHTIQGASQLQGYLGLQITLGPGEKKADGKAVFGK